MEIGYLKGETCNRNGCKGIIDATEKEGGCTCHISAPCSYCTHQTEYCPECGWSADDEQYEYMKKVSFLDSTPYKYLTDEERFNNLRDGEFGYITINSGTDIAIRLKGKHPNMTVDQIFKKLGLSENPEMPRMKSMTNDTFELTYLCD